jgi:PAS domain S-box-containing protein
LSNYRHIDPAVLELANDSIRLEGLSTRPEKGASDVNILLGSDTLHGGSRSMSRLNPLLWPERRAIWNYAIAVLSVASALIVVRLPAFHLEAAPVSLFLCAIMFSAWLGGTGPGLLATILAAIAFHYYFLPPMHLFFTRPTELPRFLIFTVSALFVWLLSAAQRSATESLRRARDDLRGTVQELQRTNEALQAESRERRHAENKLRRSEAYLAEGQRLSHTGSWANNFLSNTFFASPEMLRIFGHDPDQEKPTEEMFVERIHPEDRQLMLETADKARKEKTDYEFDYRIILPDGSLKHIHGVAHPVVNKSGELVEFIGFAIDVTQQHRAFEEIQALRDQLYNENLALREEIDVSRMFEEIVGSSPPLQAVLSQVSKVAPTESTVLITGETGTGKELIARAIHKRSQRSSRAFVSVNCAAIPRDLIGSELFGHEKGAFTGATQRRLGRFELAEGGTIFLDEVGELPADMQTSLLRVLQEREFERVGGTRSIRTDVRVVAATNRNLEAAIAAGAFRSDLFYRLNVFPIEIPPLRERREDIPLLVEYFIDRYASNAGKKIVGINKKSLDLLLSYSWPGNIRELQNVIERSVIVCDSENFSVDESWFSRPPAQADAAAQPLSEKLAAQEKEMIEAALAESKGRVSGPSGAAARLGIPQSTLDSKIKSLKINKQHFKTR